MSMDREAQFLLDDAQRRFLGPRPTPDRITAWCNACINSGLGPVKDRYGDVAAFGVIELWRGTTSAKMTAAARGAPPKPETGA